MSFRVQKIGNAEARTQRCRHLLAEVSDHLRRVNVVKIVHQYAESSHDHSRILMLKTSGDTATGASYFVNRSKGTQNTHRSATLMHSRLSLGTYRARAFKINTWPHSVHSFMAANSLLRLAVVTSKTVVPAMSSISVTRKNIDYMCLITHSKENTPRTSQCSNRVRHDHRIGVREQIYQSIQKAACFNQV